MIIDARIAEAYISGEDLERYKDDWIYYCFGRQSVFESPAPENRGWVSELYKKIREELENFAPRNGETVKQLFPQFERVTSGCTIRLVVGFPDPYDAMVLEHDGQPCLVFDLIQFQEGSLKSENICSRILTHELIHLCLREDYPAPQKMSYIEDLNYTAFNEGFAHALPYPENFQDFVFTEFLEEKFRAAKDTLRAALAETNPEKQAFYSKTADTGIYWNKFAAMAGKLYLLRHINELERIYREGWRDFAARILEDEERGSERADLEKAFDEFDALGSDRSMDNDVGEMRRILNG